MHSEITPWGSWEVLSEEPGYKVKRLIINPGQQTSYQYHLHRTEYWVTVIGNGECCINEQDHMLSAEGLPIVIPYHCRHEIRNPSETPLVIIEIQYGTICEEEDIIRLDDIYGRVEDTDALQEFGNDESRGLVEGDPGLPGIGAPPEEVDMLTGDSDAIEEKSTI